MAKREVNVDLCRILATLLVIVLHILGKGGILENAAPEQPVYWLAWLLESCAFCAVNCFGLISGYIMVDRNPKTKNIIGLWLQVVFYSFFITVLLSVFMPETISLKQIMVSCIPVLSKRWWYVTSYFGLFFFIPFLNAGIHQMPKRKLRNFLLLVLIAVGILDCTFAKDAFEIKQGYSPIWLMILYVFGAYIKKYNVKEKTTALKSGIGFLLTVMLTFLSKAVIHFATKHLLGTAKYDGIFFSYASVTVLLSSVFLLLFCLNIKASAFSEKVILFFAPATLGVYLIHAHPIVFEYLLKGAFIFLIHKPAAVMVLYVLAATPVIFTLCSVIERMRIRLFQWINAGKLCEIAEQKLSRLFCAE
jgi:surface polysaccharide O-acyltransferase-like enzyme